MKNNVNDLDYSVETFFNHDGSKKDTKIDESIKTFFNNDGTKKSSRMDEVVRKSTKCTPTKNVRRVKQKPKGTKKFAIKIIVLVAVGTGLVTTTSQLKTAIDTTNEAFAVRSTIGSSVSDNINYGSYNPNEQKPYWDYDVDSMAQDVLTKNKEYDIDTRIYGCYSRLNDYRKEFYMNKIFEKMSKIVSSSPDSYTDEEIKACLHGSFDSYLESKGVSRAEYCKIMDEVVRAYAKENISHEEINDLLESMNGGSR